MTIKKSIKAEDGTDVSILLDTVDDAIAQVIFAHGAGANMSHEFMTEITELLNQSNINVLRFNFPFMDKRELLGKKYPPDRMPKLLACYKAVVEYMTNSENRLPLFIGGKSMGSRVAVTLISNEEILNSTDFKLIKGAFCIGYPFHPAKKPEKLRLEPLLGAKKKVLIVQGDRDTLGYQDEIISYELPKHCQCIFLPDGDHSLKPRVKSGFTHDEHKKQAVKEILSFIEQL